MTNDAAKGRSARAERVHRTNAAANLALSQAKVSVRLLAGSGALVADGEHSATDLVSNALAFGRLRHSSRKPTNSTRWIGPILVYCWRIEERAPLRIDLFDDAPLQWMVHENREPRLPETSSESLRRVLCFEINDLNIHGTTLVQRPAYRPPSTVTGCVARANTTEM